MEAIDKKYLTGLRYRGSVKKDGQWVPFERPLKAADVLAWKEDEAVGDIVIVSADGSKHVVDKFAADAKPEADQSNGDGHPSPAILSRDIPGDGKQ